MYEDSLPVPQRQSHCCQNERSLRKLTENNICFTFCKSGIKLTFRILCIQTSGGLSGESACDVRLGPREPCVPAV